MPPGDEDGVVAVAAEVDRLGPDETAARASEQFHREPGEPGTGRQGEQVSGAEAQDGRDVRRDDVAQVRQDRGQGRAAVGAR